MLVLSDVLLALALWEAAILLRVVWADGQVSGVTIASVFPSVAVWVGLRALLGLYPGYGMNPVEELRRQTYAVFVTLAITATFALVVHVGRCGIPLGAGLGFPWSARGRASGTVPREVMASQSKPVGQAGGRVQLRGARGPDGGATREGVGVGIQAHRRPWQPTRQRRGQVRRVPRREELGRGHATVPDHRRGYHDLRHAAHASRGPGQARALGELRLPARHGDTQPRRHRQLRAWSREISGACSGWKSDTTCSIPWCAG